MYEITYHAPGDPSLAQRLAEKLLPLTGEVILDKGKWGLDHGTWSVLSRVCPDADIPVIQLSIDSKKPASYHYEVGRLLASFREEDILVMGSGNIVHNLGELNWGQRQSIYPWAERFGRHVRQAILDERPQEVIAYEKMGGQDASLSVPTPEHYLPLLYALGARQITDTVTFETPLVEYGSLDMTTVIFSSSFSAAAPSASSSSSFLPQTR